MIKGINRAKSFKFLLSAISLLAPVPLFAQTGVQMRTPPSGIFASANDSAPNAWGTRVDDCDGVPAEREVTVNGNMKIADRVNFISWVESTKRCTNKSVYWIQKKKNPSEGPVVQTALELTRSYAIFDALKDRVPNFVGTYVQDSGPLQIGR